MCFEFREREKRAEKKCWFGAVGMCQVYQSHESPQVSIRRSLAYHKYMSELVAWRGVAPVPFRIVMSWWRYDLLGGGGMKNGEAEKWDVREVKRDGRK